MYSLFEFIIVKKLAWFNASISFISFLKDLSAKGVYSHFDLNSKTIWGATAMILNELKHYLLDVQKKS